MSISKFLVAALLTVVAVTTIDASEPALVVKAPEAVKALKPKVRVRAVTDAIKPPLTDVIERSWYRLPDLRIGKWWYKAPPWPGRDVDLFFEIQNVGRRVARDPILWEVTCHNWGFWNPVLNRMAVSYSRRWLLPGQSKIVHIRFRMTNWMHNLRLMVDPSDRLGPPDNPPFGQKAKLHGWLSLKDGHIRESNERNNSKWVCIKVFNIWPDEWAKIVIPVINPFPENKTEIVIEMDKDLAHLKDVLEVGLPREDLAPYALTNELPPVEVVEPGQVISKFVLDPENDEENVVLMARLLDNLKLEKPSLSFKVLAIAVGPDGEAIFAEVTVVLEMQPELEPVDELTAK